MSFHQGPDDEKKKILIEETKKRMESAKLEIESTLRATALRMMVSSSVGMAMDAALKINRKPILIKALRELADKLEQEGN